MSENGRLSPTTVAAIAVVIAVLSLGVALGVLLKPEPKSTTDRFLESISQPAEPKHVEPAELEDTVRDKLAEQVGMAPKSVECPEPGLEARVGAKLTCELTAPNGDRVDVELSATQTSGSKVNFDFEVGTTVRPADGG